MDTDSSATRAKSGSKDDSIKTSDEEDEKNLDNLICAALVERLESDPSFEFLKIFS